MLDMTMATPTCCNPRSPRLAGRSLRALAMRHVPPVLKDRRGISAMEYSALGVGIVVVIVTAVAALGTEVSGMLASVGNGV